MMAWQDDEGVQRFFWIKDKLKVTTNGDLVLMNFLRDEDEHEYIFKFFSKTIWSQLCRDGVHEMKLRSTE